MDELCPTIKEQGMNQVAVTDHGNMYGALHFYKSAKKHGVKPILGCEAYVAGDKGREDRSERSSSHMVLLAQNNEGYRNLRYLISMGFMEGFYYNPRVDKELLRKHSKGLYATSACLGGVVNKCLLREGPDAAAKAAVEYRDIFEPGHFFLEIQSNGYKEQEIANQELLNIGEVYDIPMIATADAHYRRPEDSAAHEILMCIQQNKSLHEFRERMTHSDDLFVRSPQQMWDALGKLCPEAIENTMRVANDCNVELTLDQTYLPNYNVPEGFNRETYLEKLATDGLKRHIQLAKYPVDEAVYKQRLEYELGIINRMEFPGYFLIVWDFINYAKQQNIPVGPGRGSGAGSIVAWSLGITDIDPIPYDLIFERFLNPERVSMPDFDIDFCQDRRGEVINYVSEKYGKTNVGQIVTYSALSAKSVIKDVGRVMEAPYAEINELTKLIPGLVNGRKVTIEQALKIEPRLTEIQEEKPVYKDIIRIAQSLEGLNRQTGIHAAGVVIGDDPIWDYVPVCRGKEGELVTQFAKDEVEEAGLVKFDFLGLKTLTVVANAIRHIRVAPGEGPLGPNKDFDIAKADIEDSNVYKLITSGDTDGVFQLESSGFKELLKRLRPDCFEDIVAAVALYRPGPLDAGMVEDYIACKHGKKKVTYPHPVCEPILNSTYGVIVYQEQVMRIAVDLSGFTMGEADILRKAMGKKKDDVMAKMGKRFVDGAFEKNGMDKQASHDLFELIKKFAGYAFNKSHSAAYAVISFQTGFLKYYYPVEFMAALLSTETSNQDTVVRYIQSARESGIEVLPPNVNQSLRDFSVVRPEDPKAAPIILFGLGAVKGVGDAAIETIIEARQDGPFGSIYNFSERVGTRKVNKKVLEALIKSGGMDCFGRPRSQIFEVIEKALEAGSSAAKDRESGQTNLFAAFAAVEEASTGVSTVHEYYPDTGEWAEKQRLRLEKQALGFYISGHPLNPYKEDLGRLTTTNTADLEKTVRQSRQRMSEVSLAGVVSAFRERTLKSGKGRMAFVTLEDLHGSVEMIVFSKVYNDVSELLKSDDALLFRGIPTIEGADEEGGGNLKLRCSGVELLADARASKTNSVNFQIPVHLASQESFKELKNILFRCRGGIPATITITNPNVSQTTIALPDNLRVNPSEELMAKANSLFGEKVVFLQ
jgi:DNA polymerase-3 subunit alpha